MSIKRRSASPSLPSDRTLGCLLGGVFGLLLALCLGIGLLALGRDAGAPPELPAAPEAFDVEAVIEEAYMNRTFMESSATMPQPVPLTAGHLDVRPGGLADFAVQAQVGPLKPIFRGTVSFRATEGGDLRVDLVRVEVGRLPVTALVPEGTLDDVNEDVNRQLEERAGSSGLRLVGVASDETTLRFYLAATE
jgi:hypothetical protein